MNVTLYCNVSSAVRVSFTWERRIDSSWSRISDSQRSYYVVRNIQQTEQYRCAAGNDAGALYSNAATIEVLSKHVTTNLYVTSDIILEIITHPQNTHVIFGPSVSLICTSSSFSVTFL